MAALAIYALTPAGVALGRSLAARLPGRLFLPVRLAAEPDEAFERLGTHLARTWGAYRGFVMICAAGIAVRAVAPLIAGKDRDPAVVVLDQEGRYVVSLLSGHLGGANALARQVAELTGGTAVITTATDTAGLPAIDLLAREAQLAIGNLPAVRHVSAALLAGATVPVCDPEDRLGLSGRPELAQHFRRVDTAAALAGAPVAVLVDWREHDGPAGHLHLHPRVLALGLGCRRGTPAEEILAAIDDCFAAHGLARASIRGLASIEAKADEPGLLAAARKLDVPCTFYPADQLGAVDVPTPSERVRRHMGVPGVCEAAALTLARSTRLVVPKTISGRVTLAVALAM